MVRRVSAPGISTRHGAAWTPRSGISCGNRHTSLSMRTSRRCLAILDIAPNNAFRKSPEIIGSILKSLLNVKSCVRVFLSAVE